MNDEGHCQETCPQQIAQARQRGNGIDVRIPAESPQNTAQQLAAVEEDGNLEGEGSKIKKSEILEFFLFTWRNAAQM